MLLSLPRKTKGNAKHENPENRKSNLWSLGTLDIESPASSPGSEKLAFSRDASWTPTQPKARTYSLWRQYSARRMLLTNSIRKLARIEFGFAVYLASPRSVMGGAKRAIHANI